MKAAVPLTGLLRGVLWGVTALAVHWGVAAALPMPARRVQAELTVVWMELGAVGRSPGSEQATTLARGGASTHAPRSAPVRRARRRAAPERRSFRAHDASTSRVHECARQPEPTIPEQATPEQASVEEPTDPGTVGDDVLGATTEEPAAASSSDGSLAHGTDRSAAPGSETEDGRGGGPSFGGDHGAHGPVLIAALGRCVGDFPAQARVAHGEVEIAVEVDDAGRASVSSILLELPNGQGFASAARGCVERLRFAPAVDGSGATVPGHAKLKLRFDRPSTT